MSQEAAKTTTAGGREVRSQPPTFTARVDDERGTVRIRGHLDRFGAEELCRSIAALADLGHRQLAVQLDPTGTADPDAGRVLAELAERLGGQGVRLTVR